MDADHPRSYADVDDPLFDTERIPQTTCDIRTVGELLFDVDHMARQLLIDVAGGDAGPLLHGWSGFVTAAADLWTSLPGHDPGSGTHPRDEPITRLVSIADAIGRSLGTTRWPPANRPDRRLKEMAGTLGHASELVRRYGTEVPIQRTEGYRDLEAARARIMHSAYLTAHAITVALHQYGHDRYKAARASKRPIKLNQHHSPYAVPPTTEWLRRMAASEAVAHRYLKGRFTQALAGEAPTPIEDDARLPRALAGWDIQAHRTLASEAWRSNMVLVTRTQGLIAGAAIVLLDAAQLAGHLDPNDRLTSVMADAGRAWSNLASRWGDLTPPDARLDPDLMRAAAEVRAAYRELTHSTTTMAKLDDIGARSGLELALRYTLHAVESGSELAHVVAENAQVPGLTGPARALSIRAHNDIELGLAAAHPDGDVVWVSPAEILAGRLVPMPRPVRDALHHASAAITSAASTAAASAALWHANLALDRPGGHLAQQSLGATIRSTSTSCSPPNTASHAQHAPAAPIESNPLLPHR